MLCENFFKLLILGVSALKRFSFRIMELICDNFPPGEEFVNGEFIKKSCMK